MICITYIANSRIGVSIVALYVVTVTETTRVVAVSRAGGAMLVCEELHMTLLQMLL